MIDSIQSETEYAETKLGKKVKLADIDARNCFTKGIQKSTIKYIIGYNPYGKRQKIINKGLCSNKCPRCIDVKYWEHFITCRANEGPKLKFLQ